MLKPTYWFSWLMFGLLWVISLLPIGFAITLGRWLGCIMHTFGGSRRKVALRNLELCFPEWTTEHRENICTKSFEEIGIAMTTMGVAWWSSNKRLQKICHINGLEHITPALNKGQGIILVAAHYPCLEMIAQALGLETHFYVLYRVMDNPVWEYLSNKNRAKHGCRPVPRKKVRDFLSLIEQGNVGALLPDQDLGGSNSVFLPFFGIPAATLTVISDYARTTHAKVCTMSFHRTVDNRFVAKISPPLDNFPSSDDIADAHRLNQILELNIQQQPEQYLWQHRRFKRRPDGAPSLYE